ncbi:MAG: Flp pilus assembly complex ATPase component TadA [Planctomycetes bacterium]|nr:Flp pilus assembly complex ATPase component TadA [Planctomycetota bacterium]
MNDRSNPAAPRLAVATPDDPIMLLSRGSDGEPLYRALVREGRITEEEFASSLASLFQIPFLDLARESLQLRALELVPEEYARAHCCFPMSLVDGVLTLATENPLDLAPEQELSFQKGVVVRTVLATRTAILEAIGRHYHSAKVAETRFRHAIDLATQERGSLEGLRESIENLVVDLTEANSEPVVRMSTTILAEAVRRRASDIHVEAHVSEVKVRYRVDGVLADVLELPKGLQQALISRYKILASLDIAEHRVPQDGRIQVRLGERRVDLRVSTLPTHYGEKVVLRLLDGGERGMGLKDLGFDPEQLSVVGRAIRRKQGMVLTTGPTGSGKSSTLFACLEAIHSSEVNIVTIENPIEFERPGFNQVQINDRRGLTFAKALRSVLRQDPNVILVGEIRDGETAEIALQAANTGHLVFSTLHTNDAVSTVTRLLHLGTTPAELAEGLTLILAQRLLRRICPECKEQVHEPEPDRQLLGISPSEPTWRGRGCPACLDTGCLGRIGVFEFLQMDGKLRDLIARSAPEGELRRAAEDSGMQPLDEAAAQQVRAGVTSLEEVLRLIDLSPNAGRTCPKCRRGVQEEFAVCPFCAELLHLACPGCARGVLAEWAVCPFCQVSLQRGRGDGPPARAQATPRRAPRDRC